MPFCILNSMKYKMMKKFFLLAALSALFTLNVQAQAPGTLDITFNNDGIYTIDFGSNDNMNDVKIQTNQQIVCTGVALSTAFTGTLKVFRLNPNGTLDNGFGVNGVFSFLTGAETYGYESQILDNGKILVAGISMNQSFYADILLIRLNQNGTIDSSFGNNGFTVTGFSSRDDFAYGLAVQPDGKILVAGEMTDTINYQNNPSIVRFTEDGFVDNTFGVNGQLLIPAIGGDNGFRCITIQPDGKILAAGRYSFVNTGLVDFDFCVVRADVNGVLDPTFGTNGIALTSVGSGLNQAFGIDLDTAQNIVVAGVSNNATTDMALLKYDPSGTLDATFGVGGIVESNIAAFDAAYDVKVQTDNNIVVSGTSGSFPSPTGATVWKFLANGAIDNSFGTNGYVTTNIASDNEDGNSVVLQADGKIVVSGKYRNTNANNNDGTVLRYNNTVVNASVNEINVSNTLSVYPNPASSNQTIMIASEKNFTTAQVKITDLLGSLVYSTNGSFQNGNFELQLPAGINKGVYFVTVSDAKTNMFHKLTVN